MNPTQQPDSYETVDYVGWLRRRWWIALGLTIVGGVGAFAYVQVAPKTYSAMAAVNVSPVGSDSSSQVANSRTANSAVNLDTEAQVVVSTSVATLAGKALHSPLPPWQLSKQITVTVPPNSSILDITCDAPAAAEAQLCAQAFATAYLDHRASASEDQINSQLAAVHKKQGDLETEIASTKSKEKGLSKNSSKRLTYEQTVKADRDELSALNSEGAKLASLLADSVGGQIITNAVAPSAPSSPQKTVVVPSGLVAGLLVGLGLGFLADRRDKRVHAAKDIQRLFNVPVLADLPRGTFGRDVSVASPRSKAGHAFTELSYTVSASLGEGSHLVFVAGTTSGPGRSIVAANFAAALARTHADVVLVCADLNGSIAPDLLGAPGGGDGLVELLAGNASLRDVVRRPAGTPGLWVIPPGEDASMAAYSFRYDAVRDLVARLRRDTRFIVVEAPATDEGAESFALAEFADAALVAIEVPRTKRTDAADAIRRIRQLRAPLLGAIVSEPVGGRVSVRPPRAERSSRMSGGFDAGRDRMAGRDSGEMSAMSMSAVPDRRLHSRDGHGDRADRFIES